MYPRWGFAGPTLAFPVPLPLAPPHRRTYGRGELHARAARRLLLAQPAAPSPLPPCDALRLAHERNLLRPLSASQCRHIPFAGEAAAIEEPRDAAAAARSPPLHRANPPDCPHSFPAREQAARSLANRCPAPVRAPRTRESVPVVATLTPRRVARRCGSTLSGSNLPGQVKKPSLLSCCGTRAR